MKKLVLTILISCIGCQIIKAATPAVFALSECCNPSLPANQSAFLQTTGNNLKVQPRDLLKGLIIQDYYVMKMYDVLRSCKDAQDLATHMDELVQKFKDQHKSFIDKCFQSTDQNTAEITLLNKCLSWIINLGSNESLLKSLYDTFQKSNIATCCQQSGLNCSLTYDQLPVERDAAIEQINEHSDKLLECKKVSEVQTHSFFDFCHAFFDSYNTSRNSLAKFATNSYLQQNVPSKGRRSAQKSPSITTRPAPNKQQKTVSNLFQEDSPSIQKKGISFITDPTGEKLNLTVFKSREKNISLTNEEQFQIIYDRFELTKKQREAVLATDGQITLINSQKEIELPKLSGIQVESNAQHYFGVNNTQKGLGGGHGVVSEDCNYRLHLHTNAQITPLGKEIPCCEGITVLPICIDCQNLKKKTTSYAVDTKHSSKLFTIPLEQTAAVLQSAPMKNFLASNGNQLSSWTARLIGEKSKLLEKERGSKDLYFILHQMYLCQNKEGVRATYMVNVDLKNPQSPTISHKTTYPLLSAGNVNLADLNNACINGDLSYMNFNNIDLEDIKKILEGALKELAGRIYDDIEYTAKQYARSALDKHHGIIKQNYSCDQKNKQFHLNKLLNSLFDSKNLDILVQCIHDAHEKNVLDAYNQNENNIAPCFRFDLDRTMYLQNNMLKYWYQYKTTDNNFDGFYYEITIDPSSLDENLKNLLNLLVAKEYLNKHHDQAPGIQVCSEYFCNNEKDSEALDRKCEYLLNKFLKTVIFLINSQRKPR
jgi:hypothetical protein